MLRNGSSSDRRFVLALAAACVALLAAGSAIALAGSLIARHAPPARHGTHPALGEHLPAWAKPCPARRRTHANLPCRGLGGTTRVAPLPHRPSQTGADSGAGGGPPAAAISSVPVQVEPAPEPTPPDTSILRAPPLATAMTWARFTFSSDAPDSSFECKLDEGGWVPCGSSAFYSALQLGQHEFAVRAIGPEEQADPTPAAYAWTVETGSPPPPPSEPPVEEPPVEEPPAEEPPVTEPPSEPPAEEEPSSEPPPPPPTEEPPAEESIPACTTTVTSVSAAQSAVSAAAAGAVVCLTDGSYGKVSLNASKPAPGVMLRAANPGKATIAGASLSGSHLTLARFVSTDSVVVQPGASAMTIEHNRVTGGGQGIDAGPTSTTTINDTRVIGNQLIGPFGEDAIHLNRYHDSDGDGIGILIEGNEITGVRENGNHSDCLQTVWVGDHIIFRRNYLHDNRCQGFFVKDQASLGGVSGPIAGITVEDNLFLRNKEPCAASAPGCGQPMYFQVFGPYSGFTMSRNTIWGDGVDSIAAFRESTGADTKISRNVIYRLWSDTNMSGISLTENTVCKRETGSGGSWPSSRPGETTACSLTFADTAADDYRISGDRGVDWAPGEVHYGP